ncbi:MULTISPECIES: SH3 domain-containing protein [Caldilinea]|jgi:uncharacterized repeat protein (TIGR01451 family)|uniref:Putative N-acetylmuramoyl-L-alanine amidase n=1 Tax=Caldilinea aerophila (strain DSM 14535 / JCM 11387 / NBRC 104270 / STL-6-O1) TaxID=926550 RepID=I0I4X2_CALAS|nr:MULTISPECIES: SH3 domain-containing protein [Caldilinea]MBO9393881.1 SH3 domain-containing protein [Caldilinea sp.]BAM00310.1 putative N-acetylmuramoyl-L-alanine amidase [Caldilinea aerophila DSM 14535 = NBRC 104270]GIV71669.1 MAG: hypothetical protein KatS3mg049_0225 [Caldilinea sp.]
MKAYRLLVQSGRRNKLWAMFLLVGAILWGGAQAWAADGTPTYRQTIPPPPTATPTPQPPTPTPRPPRPTPRPETNQTNQTNQGSAPVVLPTQATPSSPQARATLTATVNVVTLNVRQGPGTTFAVIGRLTRGTEVTLVARNQSADWLKMCCIPDTKTQGWVSAQFLTPRYSEEELAILPIEDGAAPLQPPTDALTGTVSVPVLNVRAEPSVDAEILGKFASETIVYLLGRNAEGDWWLVCCLPDATNGWVAARFVRANASEAELTALPVLNSRDGADLLPSSPLSTTLIGLTVQPVLQAIQGEPATLTFNVVNLGDANAVGLEFSFELPAGLRFVSASATDGGEVKEEMGENGASVIVATWPELAVGGSAIVNVNVIAESELPDGAVLDGAAVVQARNAEWTFTSVLVGLPPAEPPDFW